MATTRTSSTAIRLGITGDPEVKRKLEDIGQTGDAAAQRMARSFVKAEADVEAAIARRERQMAKLNAIMPQTAMQMQVDQRAGTGFGEYEGSARRSSAVFAQMLAEQDQLEQRARALRAAIDPAWAAQERFNTEIGKARELISRGAISLDDYVAKLRMEQQALDAAAAKHNGVESAVKRSGSAFASAAPQVQDFFVQVSMGTNPINAAVVQFGQLAGQLVYVEGRVGAVASFLMGPWGLALQVGLLALAPFVAKLWEGDEAAKAQQKAIEEHRKAVLALADAQQKAILTAQRRQALVAADLKLEYDSAIATRQSTQALLEKAQAQARIAAEMARTSSGSAEEAIGKEADLTAANRRVAEINGLLTKNASEVVRLGAGFNAAYGRMIQMRAEAASTPEGAIGARFDRRMSAAMRDPALMGIGNEGRLRAKLDELLAERDRELKAIQKSTVARDAETLTANQVAKMLRGEMDGVHITSTTGGKHVKNSYHYRNQAVDFVPAGGMASMTKDDVRRIFESRGINVVELLGPGDKGHSDHFHVAWTKGKNSLDEFTDAAKRAKEAADELTDLRLFTNGDAIGRALVGVREAVARQKGEFDRAAQDALQYDSNPLAGIVGEYDAQQRVEVDRWNEENARRVAKQRDDIAMLSNLWQTGFSVGAKGVWDIFRQQGMQVLSELLARWMVMGNLKGAFGEGGVNTGIFGQIGKLFSAGINVTAARNGANAALDAAVIPRFAVGTHYSSAGAALVGENGPELVNLPRGSRVTPAGETRRILAMNDNAAPRITKNYFTGNLLTPEFWALIQQSDDMAAARGAAGGASIGQAEMRAQSARRLGRRW